jgi:hypothetical protein
MNKQRLQELLDEGELFYHAQESKGASVVHHQYISDNIASRADAALAQTPFQIFLRPRKTAAQLHKPPSPISSPNESDASFHTTTR